MEKDSGATARTTGPIADAPIALTPAFHWRASKCTFSKKDWAQLHSKDMTIVQDLDGNVVAAVWGEDDQEERVFARLIAAAPDLLHEAEWSEVLLTACLGLMQRHGIEREIGVDLPARLARLRSAISKATGAA